MKEFDKFRDKGPCLWAIEHRASVWSAGLPPLSCAPCASEYLKFIAGKLGDNVEGRFMGYLELDLVKAKRRLTRVPLPGGLEMRHSPPMALNRWRMLRRPLPPRPVRAGPL